MIISLRQSHPPWSLEPPNKHLTFTASLPPPQMIIPYRTGASHRPFKNPLSFLFATENHDPIGQNFLEQSRNINLENVCHGQISQRREVLQISLDPAYTPLSQHPLPPQRSEFESQTTPDNLFLSYNV